MNYTIWQEKESKPLTEEQLRQAVSLLKARANRDGKKLPTSEESEKARFAELEAKRQARLAREEYESLTDEERAEYDALYSKTAIARRLAAAAMREADEHWTRADQERQQQALLEWRKGKGKIKVRDQSGNVWEQDAPISGSEEARKIAELDQQGREQAQARLDARARRELEAEAFDDELERIWASLDMDEQKIFARLADEEPDMLTRVREFKAERRNPIEHINDTRTLYRLANNPPREREEWVEPLNNIENVDSPAMLYKMARKQIEQAQPKKQKQR